MRILERGYAYTHQHSGLLWLEVRDKDTHEIFYDPDYKVLESVSEQFNVDFEKLREVVQSTPSGTHGIVLIPEEFRRYVLEMSIVHLYYSGSENVPVCKDTDKGEWISFDHTATGQICLDCQDKVELTIERDGDREGREGGQTATDEIPHACSCHKRQTFPCPACRRMNCRYHEVAKARPPTTRG